VPLSGVTTPILIGSAAWLAVVAATISAALSAAFCIVIIASSLD
jgi:hypothetical protein